MGTRWYAQVSVKQCARRTTESGPPLPLLITHEIFPQWAMPSGNREMRVGTINARGMSQSKQMEIEDLLLEYGVSICAVQESHERGSMAQHFLHYTWISRPRSRDHIKKDEVEVLGSWFTTPWWPMSQWAIPRVVRR